MKNGILLLLILLLNISANKVKGQDRNKLDSLWNEYTQAEHDSTRITLLLEMGDVFAEQNPDSALYFFTKSKTLSEKIGDEKSLATSISSVGFVQMQKYNYDEAINQQNIAVDIYKKLNDKVGLAKSLQYIGLSLYNKGNYNEAIEYLLESSKYLEELNDIKGIASISNSIGIVYEYLKYHDKSLEYKEKALSIYEELGDKSGIAITSLNVGGSYYYRKQLSKALQFYNKAGDHFANLNDSKGLLLVNMNIGNIYMDLSNYSKAINYYNKSLVIAEEINDSRNLALLLANMSRLNRITADSLLQQSAKEPYLTRAIQFAKRSLKYAKLAGSMDVLEFAYEQLTFTNADLENFKTAFIYFDSLKFLSDSLFNVEKSEQLAEMTTKYETEKKEQQIALQEVELEKKDIEVKQNRNQRNAFIGGSSLLLILALVIFIGYTQKKKANKLLSSQKIEIEDKNVKLETANKENAEKNKKITDSILYAKRIQEAILPLDKIIKENMEDSFVLYEPRDIVSGDFYWMEVVQEKVLFAAVDCTGHGVPGALVSIVGHNGLNQAVKEFGITEPAKILDKLNELVVDTFSSKDEHDIKDGMDIALCCLNTKTNTLDFAGANNPLYLIRNGKLQVYKADKQPIGKFTQRKVFTNQSITLQENDSVYIFSDGYADQFGGPDDKRFTRKQFRDILLEINDQPMQAQKSLLEEKFNMWKNNTVQIDDVLVMGVRIT